MRNRAIKLMFTSIILATTLTLGSASYASADSSAQDDRVDVLVSFAQKPGPGEQALIQNAGGKVKRNYHIVPTIAASIPKAKLDSLRRNPKIVAVEEDGTVNIIGKTLPYETDQAAIDQTHPIYNGTGVKIAVLDTGIDLDHPDLRVAGNVTFIPETVNGDDDNGHGTMVAGIIAALDNGIGATGIAPEATLYSVKVLYRNGSGWMSSILAGIEWAVDNHMQVINMSFGSFLEMPTSIVTALNNAYNTGIVIVAGAGNSGNASGGGSNIWSPARYPSVIAVGATDSLNNRYAGSSTGYQLELMAPGVNVYSTAMGGGYGYLTGTSASSPHVAGVAALLISAGITDNVKIRNQMQSSAQDLGAAGWDTLYGRGLVDANGALKLSEPPDRTPPTTAISCSGTPGNGGWYKSNVTITVSAADNPGGSGVAKIEYSLNGGLTWNIYTSPFAITTDGRNVVLARSWDKAGNEEGPPAFVIIKIDRTPPVLTVTATPTQIAKQKRGVMVEVSYINTAQDSASGVDAPLSTVLIDEYGVLNQDLGAGFRGTTLVEAWCNDANGRTYIIRFTAHDLAGNYASADAVITVPLVPVSTGHQRRNGNA